MTRCIITRCDTALCLIGQQDFSVRNLNTENRPSELRFTPFFKRRFPIMCEITIAFFDSKIKGFSFFICFRKLVHNAVDFIGNVFLLILIIFSLIHDR